MRRVEKGFSCIELLIDVALILIIAAIAILNLLRTRMAANEAQAVGSVRTINTGAITTYINRSLGLVTGSPFPCLSNYRILSIGGGFQRSCVHGAISSRLELRRTNSRHKTGFGHDRMKGQGCDGCSGYGVPGTSGFGRGGILGRDEIGLSAVIWALLFCLAMPQIRYFA